MALPTKLNDVRVYEAHKVPLRVRKGLSKSISRTCTDIVNDDWANKHLTKNKYIFVLFGRTTPQIKGFALASPVKSAIYIDLICSGMRGGGSKILKAVELSAKILGLKKMELNSLKEAEGFYLRNNFVESNNPCGKNPLIKRKGNMINGYRYTKCIT